MPNWSTQPPAHAAAVALELRRTPGGRPLTLVSLDDDIIGCPTHYYRGRTTPCTNPTCDACAEGLPWRWHAWLCCLAADTRRICLFELTAHAATQLHAIAQSRGSLRGTKITATRANYKPNSRVLLQIADELIPPASLPPSPGVLPALAKIWDIPLPALEQSGHTDQGPRLHTDRLYTDTVKLHAADNHRLPRPKSDTFPTKP